MAGGWARRSQMRRPGRGVGARGAQRLRRRCSVLRDAEAPNSHTPSTTLTRGRRRAQGRSGSSRRIVHSLEAEPPYLATGFAASCSSSISWIFLAGADLPGLRSDRALRGASARGVGGRRRSSTGRAGPASAARAERGAQGALAGLPSASLAAHMVAARARSEGRCGASCAAAGPGPHPTWRGRRSRAAGRAGREGEGRKSRWAGEADRSARPRPQPAPAAHSASLGSNGRRLHLPPSREAPVARPRAAVGLLPVSAGDAPPANAWRGNAAPARVRGCPAPPQRRRPAGPRPGPFSPRSP